MRQEGGIRNRKGGRLALFMRLAYTNSIQFTDMINQTILNKIKAGTTVRVFEKVKEGDKERIARFEGLVLGRKHGKEAGATFTVRATIAGVGVEKVYPVHTPIIEKVEILTMPKKVRRSKIYFVRDISRKALSKKISADLKEARDLSAQLEKEKQAAIAKAKEEAAEKAKAAAAKKAEEAAKEAPKAEEKK